MTIKDSINQSLKDAMRSNNEMAKKTIRMVLSSVKLTEVEKGVTLDDAAVISILQKEIKSRAEVIAESEKANRPDLVEAAKEEMAFLSSFLPKQLGEEELKALVAAAIQEAGATTPADMGKVMKVLLPKVQGQAPGNVVSQLVRQMLES